MVSNVVTTLEREEVLSWFGSTQRFIKQHHIQKELYDPGLKG